MFHLFGMHSWLQEPMQRDPDFPPHSHSNRPTPHGEVQGISRPAENHSPSSMSSSRHLLQEDDITYHTIPCGEPSHSSEESHLSLFYPWYNAFSLYPVLMTIDEGRTLDLLVNGEFCLLALLSLHYDRSVQMKAVDHIDGFPPISQYFIALCWYIK